MPTKNDPKISIILPVYNAADFIVDAVNSILLQTFKDFELIIINDGSTDKTALILKEMRDSRIVLINQRNTGLVGALQKGIAVSRAELIARHDADDISEPDRLQKQYDFLTHNTDVVIVGSSMQTMDMSGKVMHNHYVLIGDAELKAELLIRSPFAHGSVMFRKQAYTTAGGYRTSDWPAEDYGLWVRLAAQGKFANIDDALYTYRENTTGISSLNTNEQAARAQAIRRLAWQNRKTLVPDSLKVAQYHQLPMGEFRIARIVHNLMSAASFGIRRRNFFTAAKCLRLIFYTRPLRRKYVRLLLMRIGIKHGF